MIQAISRRTFLSHAAVIAASATRWVHAAPAVRVGVMALSALPANPRIMGLTLGAEEASHAAGLFGGGFELLAAPVGDLHNAGLSAIIGDTDCAHSTRISRLANDAGIPFLNVGCSANALRTCGHSTFHVAPSDAMSRDARTAAGVNGEVLAWHPSLVRFGADTLNRRFQQRFGVPMTAGAWTAWLATKILWETALRIKSAEPAALTNALVGDAAQFDGHKGLPLSFRPWDHQLRQPLYVMQGARAVEVPVAHMPGEPARVLLDRLGATTCSA